MGKAIGAGAWRGRAEEEVNLEQGQLQAATGTAARLKITLLSSAPSTSEVSVM